MHWCCCSELIVHTNAGITVKCLLSDVWYFTFFQSIFSWGEITCVWVLNLCLNYRFLQQLTRSRTILYNKVWKDNWTYWDTCQYYIIYGSIGTIWVHFKVITSYFKLDPRLPIFWSYQPFIIWWINTDERLNISTCTYLLFKTTTIHVKNDKKNQLLHPYHFHCRFELVFKLNIIDKLPAFTKQLIFACNM